MKWLKQSSWWLRGLSVAALVWGGAAATAADASKTAAAVKGSQAAPSSREVVVRPLAKLDSGDVFGSDGKKIGHINGMAIDAGRGRIAYAVVEFDHLADIGDKNFAVPWKALDKQFDPKDVSKLTYAMNVNREQLKNARGFARNDWPNMCDMQWGREVHAFWKVSPYWEEREEGRLTMRAEGQDAAPRDREPLRIEGTPVSPGHSGPMLRSADLKNHGVLDQGGKDIADLEAVMVDTQSGRCVYGILQFDKMPDLAKDYLHPVPWQSLRIAPAGEDQSKPLDAMFKDKSAFTITLNTPAEKVRNGPKFPEREWPNMTQQWGEGIYSAYGVTPFWSKIEQPGADLPK